MGLPQILITFKQLAATAIARSEKGIVCLVVLDDTNQTFDVTEYNYATEVDDEDYTAANYQAIQDAFLGGPNKVIVVRGDAAEDFADVSSIVDAQRFNWLAMISSVATDQQAVVTYTKAKNTATAERKIKCICSNATTTDDMHVVNFVNTAVKRKLDDAEISGYLYLGRLAGMLAGLPYTRSSTYYKFQDLESVTEPADVNASINAGGFVLINNNGEPKVGRGVNSLVTLGTNITASMKKIAIVESMDQILEDVATTFADSYVGNYKNSYDNQCLFISAVNGYFRALAKEDILDPNFDNKAEVDVDTQRQAWITSGRSEAESWDDTKVKKMTFQSWMYLMGNVKILDALEDLSFSITME